METTQGDDLRVERDFTPPDPEYGPGVESETARECLEAWRSGKPWTKLRVLRGPSECPRGASCEGSLGHFGASCPKKVEAVQYASSCGSALFYCEDHALEQADWDVVLYDSKPKEREPMSAEDEAWLLKFRTKDKKRHLGDLIEHNDGEGWVEL